MPCPIRTAPNLIASFIDSIESDSPAWIVKGTPSSLAKANSFAKVLVLNNDSEAKVVEEVKNLIEKKEISYVFLLKNEEINEKMASLISNTNIKVVYFHPLANLSEEEEKNKNDYLSIMNENIELIKEEAYN